MNIFPLYSKVFHFFPQNYQHSSLCMFCLLNWVADAKLIMYFCEDLYIIEKPYQFNNHDKKRLSKECGSDCNRSCFD